MVLVFKRREMGHFHLLGRNKSTKSASNKKSSNLIGIVLFMDFLGLIIFVNIK